MSSYRNAPLLPVIATLFWLSASPLALAQESTDSERAAIEVVTIEHRAPDRIRLLLQDALDPRGSIGQIDDKLVIATTAGNLAELKTLIERQDVPPRRVIVSADFNHLAALPNPLSQFSEPALEGELVEFARYLPAPRPSTAEEPLAEQEPSAGEEPSARQEPSAGEEPSAQQEPSAEAPDIALIVSAEIHDGAAAVLVEQIDPDGRSLRHQVYVTLSEWHVLDPTGGPPFTAVRVDLLP